MVITKENIEQYIYGTIMDCSDRGITSIEYLPEGITTAFQKVIIPLGSFSNSMQLSNINQFVITFENGIRSGRPSASGTRDQRLLNLQGEELPVLDDFPCFLISLFQDCFLFNTLHSIL